MRTKLAEIYVFPFWRAYPTPDKSYKDLFSIQVCCMKVLSEKFTIVSQNTKLMHRSRVSIKTKLCQNIFFQMYLLVVLKVSDRISCFRDNYLNHVLKCLNKMVPRAVRHVIYIVLLRIFYKTTSQTYKPCDNMYLYLDCEMHKY